MSLPDKENHMQFKSITQSISLLTMASLLSAGLALAEPVTIKQLALEKESVRLIGQMEQVARDIHYNADRLSSLTVPARTTRWSHSHHLTQIKELVNEGLQPALARLTEIQPELRGWQQDTIDRLLASAQALAADTNSAILTHNETGALPLGLNSEYRDLIASINEHAQSLVKTSDAAGNYATAHEQAAEAGLLVPKT
jgi:hypothetical protein